jgi:hypothetical protein
VVGAETAALSLDRLVARAWPAALVATRPGLAMLMVKTRA